MLNTDTTDVPPTLDNYYFTAFERFRARNNEDVTG